jgi:hypothetical protein
MQEIISIFADAFNMKNENDLFRYYTVINDKLLIMYNLSKL